ncbi:MAG TPA: hypothetical protein VFQ61_11850 [Polyangiaceae bacterium]|nr:hypothetical protein [Polyangiaceae bacterium]
MNLAALDLGSNSFHLLVARVGAGGALTKLASHKEVLRLGAVVQEHGHLPEAHYAAALAAVGTMVSVARAFEAERIIAVGTSALRDASNGRAFCSEAARSFRIPVELISGRREAELAYLGARSGLAGLPERVAVVDIGGGSVEIAVGDGRRCLHIESLPLGFLRLAKALAASGPDGAERLRAEVMREIGPVAARLQALRPEAWIFSGGTARAVGKLVSGDGEPVVAADVERVTQLLERADRSHLVELGVEATRVDAIGLGASVLGALVEGFALHAIRISPRGLREGVLLRELFPEPWSLQEKRVLPMTA